MSNDTKKNKQERVGGQQIHKKLEVETVQPLQDGVATTRANEAANNTNDKDQRPLPWAQNIMHDLNAVQETIIASLPAIQRNMAKI